MIKKKLWLISFLIVSLVGSTTQTFGQRRVKLQREFDVKAGREVIVKEAGLKIKFDALLEDSRCPEGVDCVWAGNGKISVTLKKGRMRGATFDLNTMTEPKSITHQGYEITLVKLAPYPKNNVESKKEDYVATLIVKRKQR